MYRCPKNNSPQGTRELLNLPLVYPHGKCARAWVRFMCDYVILVIAKKSSLRFQTGLKKFCKLFGLWESEFEHPNQATNQPFIDTLTCMFSMKTFHILLLFRDFCHFHLNCDEIGRLFWSELIEFKLLFISVAENYPFFNLTNVWWKIAQKYKIRTLHVLRTFIEWASIYLIFKIRQQQQKSVITLCKPHPMHKSFYILCKLNLLSSLS